MTGVDCWREYFTWGFVGIALSATTVSPVAAPEVGQVQDGVLIFVTDRGGDSDIYSVLPDGSKLTQLTHNSGVNFGAVLSPDGSRIVFDSDRAGSTDLWIMSHDGSDPAQLTHCQGRCSEAAWSPRGDHIAFHSAIDGGGIFEIGADGSGLRRISPRGLPASSPSWSPDGTQIAFAVDRNRHSEIWVMGSDGSNPTQLTNNPIGGNQHPQWSPDGRWILFNSWRNEEEASSDIWVIAADGSGERRLTSSAEMEEYPKWSPDGASVLFTVGNAAVFTMSADGTNRRRVTEGHFFTAGSDWGRAPFNSHLDLDAELTNSKPTEPSSEWLGSR